MSAGFNDDSNRPLFRGAGTIYIRDNPTDWRWAIDVLTQHVINSEGHRRNRQLKGRVFKLFKTRAAMALFPLRHLPESWREADPHAHLIIRGHSGAGIFFNRESERVTRRLPSSRQFMRARWIHSQESVQRLCPHVGNWDGDALTFQEDYIPGQTVPLHDLDRGIETLRRLWPDMAAVYRSRTVKRRLRGETTNRYKPGKALFESIGRLDIWTRAYETDVVHGLIHGDFKPQNILMDGPRLVVIDWYESFMLAPPLFDIFYNLFWFARFHPPKKVVHFALTETTWLEQALPGCLEPSPLCASLVVFARELARRLQSERHGSHITARLSEFIREAIRVLAVDASPSRS